MLLELALFLLLGIVAGTFTGLIPGVHSNLICIAFVALAASALSGLEPILLAVSIVSMAMTHTFVSFIPSVFLGCPDTDTGLSVLPGHELLKSGKGYEAISLATYGGGAAIITLFLIVLPSIWLIPFLHKFLLKSIPLTISFIPIKSISIMSLVLISVSALLISMEKKRSSALIVFLLTGTLGFITLNLDLKEPLLPLLTGLFGASMLTISIRTKIKIPKQRINSSSIKINSLWQPLAGAFLGSFAASPILSLLPGLGSGQAAIIGNTFSRKIKRIFSKIKISKDTEEDRKEFLVLLGATNTLVMGFSFIAFYLVSRTRTGAAASIEKILGVLSTHFLIIILFAILISSIAAFFLTLSLGEFFSTKINKINYTKLSAGTLVFLSLLSMTISGFLGFAVLIIATLTGIYCISLGVRRTNMMGCLLLPTIIIYLL